MSYVENFEKLGMGMFVHYGLYSILARGEWAKNFLGIESSVYEKLTEKFKPSKNWAKNLVATAKRAGAKYITLTTRHHDGFSLYDTCGLSDFDAPHSACGRDIVAEFVKACNDGGIVPFFYHTLMDWHHPDYDKNFPAYIDYLVSSVEILCRNYGRIGGLWFDGLWNKPNDDWQEDRLYGTIRKYQPEAMIINNTGLSELGKVGHPELDGVTFERGKPAFVDCSDKRRAGKMCQVLNDHWAYAKDDLNYKSISELIENLIDCRIANCNFLLNVGPMGNGLIKQLDKAMLSEIGKWIKINKDFIYNCKAAGIEARNADILTDGKYYYAVMKKVPMFADVNVAIGGKIYNVNIKTDKKITNAIWLDNGSAIETDGNIFELKPFAYGKSLSVRVARFMLQ